MFWASACFRGTLPSVRLALPPALSPGDLAAVVAPSSPFRRDDLWRGLSWIRARYRIDVSAGILATDGYLAGSDARRSAELARAMLHPEAKAILAIRGGYGAMRILDELPWSQFAERPKWIVGHSDVTALHAMAWRAGIASVHGPNVTGLGSSVAPSVRASWIAAIECPASSQAWRGLRVLRGGSAKGLLVGGNLALLAAMAAAGRLWIPLGAILVLEDVTESPYRIDRMLTSLMLGGYLARASAIVFGDFVRCPPGKDGRTVDEVLDERTRALGIPVRVGAPFGHGERNNAFLLGVPAELSQDELRFEPAE
jgi:muramoyltetrapeptide carboxypeptidase